MYRGRVLALQAMVFLGSTPIGGPIVGWVSDVGGPRAGVVLGGVACLAAALYGFRALRGVAPMRPHDAARIEEPVPDEAVALAD